VNESRGSEYTWVEGLAICLSMIGVQQATQIIAQWGPFFYSPSEDVGRTVYVTTMMVTVIFVLGTVWDAITDPLIGAWSDRTRTRPGWARIVPLRGRRRPFIFWGSIFLTFTSIFFWFPPIAGTSHVNFGYGVALLCLHWFVFTITVVPLTSLGPEIARTERARVSLGIWTAVGMIVGLALAIVLPGVLIAKLDPARIEDRLIVTLPEQDVLALAALSPEATDPAHMTRRDGAITSVITGELLGTINGEDAALFLRERIPEARRDRVSVVLEEGSFSPTGYRRVATMFALISLVLLQLPVWLVRERFDSATRAHAEVPWLQGVREAFGNRPFVVYCVAFFLFNIGLIAVQNALPYWAELGLGGDESTVTVLMIPFVVTCIVFYVAVPSLTKRLHTKWMTFLSFLIITTGLPWMYFIPRMEIAVETKFMLGGALFGYCGIGQSIIYAMMTPILGEIIDYDELRSGQRREALYNGLHSFVTKLAIACAIAIAMTSMRLWGKSAEAYTGVLLVGPIAACFGFLGMIAILFYPVLCVTPDRGNA